MIQFGNARPKEDWASCSKEAYQAYHEAVSRICVLRRIKINGTDDKSNNKTTQNAHLLLAEKQKILIDALKECHKKNLFKK